MVRGQGGAGLAGAVVGGAVGGLAGNQVGGGRGRTAATIAGVAAGALIGNAVGQNATRSQGRDYYRVTVQLDNGQMHSLDYADAPSVRIGDRVRLDGNQLYR
jgi:outer membrane lipoprotein SlyB